ncbi:DUF2795 domain-containing protein [Amycolatopsis sp. FDAARGOS 1241]|uniref:DUF2795 domain-containing protein n=1 Tax=Amycolatopsis sp. FDAARGOS 1241 TaxID=2778070 RepID=UPI00194EF011|nr:DUF2795 domain-containing protein [Amycolatopsis sp. FDAARGOS 1241]QRP49548.1 DUF2795 domain-containing protein [Amycolatopsis sp. FDAARGOS 1241]
MSFPDHDTLSRHLAGVRYPCGRAELLRQATAAGAGDDVLGPLGALAAEARYDDLDGVWTALETNRSTSG